MHVTKLCLLRRMVPPRLSSKMRRSPPTSWLRTAHPKKHLTRLLRVTSFKLQVILLLPYPADRHIHHGIGGGVLLLKVSEAGKYNMTYNTFWDQKATLFDGDCDLAEMSLSWHGFILCGTQSTKNTPTWYKTYAIVGDVSWSWRSGELYTKSEQHVCVKASEWNDIKRLSH